jgi:hypothetical protein
MELFHFSRRKTSGVGYLELAGLNVPRGTSNPEARVNFLSTRCSTTVSVFNESI